MNRLEDSGSPMLPGEIGRLRPRAGVAVLRFDLDSPRIDPASARALLNPEEIARAEGFARSEDRRRRLAARALLRLTLGSALGRPPTELMFEGGAHGKLRLAAAGPAFSLSHSGGRLLIAISQLGEVGVDVELPGVGRDLCGAARISFSADEIRALGRHEGSERERAFLRIWTAKEAALKAFGVGLQRPMREVVLDLDALDTLSATPWQPGSARHDGQDLALHDVSAKDDVACLAAISQPGRSNSAG